jgi:hypothetical protein
MFARHNSAAGASIVTYTILVNGVATALVVALSAAAVGQASNLVNTVAVVQGDRVSLRAANGNPAAGVDSQVTLELA